MFKVIRYGAKSRKQWDDLVAVSKNGSFIFYRDYLDYHSDRYPDHSFLIYRKNRLVGILPGTVSGDVYYSHSGLTFGGLILSPEIVTKDVIRIFDLVNGELKLSGVKEVIYKPGPYIYHTYPSQEDLYALFLLNAEKIGCSISSALFQENKLKFIESRKGGIRKSIEKEIKVEETTRFELFWPVLEDNLLKKYNKAPIHSLSEIQYLKSRFPGNIRLYIAMFKNEVVGGCVIYLMKNIAHVQYISANATGRKLGVLDFIFEILLNKTYLSIPVFDFGHSTEDMGKILNGNLIFQKEGFGGRGIVYETYKYSLE